MTAETYYRYDTRTWSVDTILWTWISKSSSWDILN